MKNTCLLAAMIVATAAPAFAQTGNGAPSGPHYNLNIIGVEKAKNPDLTGSQRHTIFVALGKNDTVTSRIYLTPALDFEVCDGNGFDAAIDCQGNQIANEGAVFALPCNTNIHSEPTDPGPLFPCEGEDPQLAYEVWARALGAPGGQAVITTCATDAETGEEVCSTENVLLVRKKGKSTFTNVTQELTSLVGCVSDPASDGVICGRFALFRNEFVDWFWQYANSGLRLAQIRFYPIDVN
jgi:hypothetical protein